MTRDDGERLSVAGGPRQLGERAETSDGPADDDLAAELADTRRRLAESSALLATEISDRRQGEIVRVRLLRRLIAAQEAERRRIARDLHDDLGQRLTALRLTLEAMARERQAMPDTLAQALQMLGHIDQTLDFIAWEVRPAALDEMGLTTVLDTYVQEWSQHAGISATFHARPRDVQRFSSEVEATVYRIAQEALNNVAKHAQARAVNVLLEQRGESIALVVEDDGVGFRPLGASETRIGLSGMQERAAAVGGTLEIEPTPGGGATLIACIPIASRSPSEAPLTPPAGGSDGMARLKAGNADASGEPVPPSIRLRLQELQQAVAARDDFIATVAHELRNPIAPLVFQVRLALDKAEEVALTADSMPAAWVQAQLRRIEQRLHRLLETLDRLLDVSRLSSGRIDLQPEPLNLGQTVRDVMSTLEAELAVARCKTTFTEQGEPANGWWDRLRLEQICQNLLSNAIRFGAGRPIDVLVTADRDFATLEVRDYGVGIAPDQQGRIFERFERGLEKRSGGFGIGLWVVKNICAAMSGTVSVESELGDGARFTVMLPRRREREPVNKGTE